MRCFDPPSYMPEVESEEVPMSEELQSGEFGPGLLIEDEAAGAEETRRALDWLLRDAQELGLYDECVCGCGAPYSSRCWREE